MNPHGIIHGGEISPLSRILLTAPLYSVHIEIYRVDAARRSARPARCVQMELNQ